MSLLCWPGCLSWLSCPVLSILTCQANLSGWPDLPWFSCPGCPIPAVLSQMSSPSWPGHAVMVWPSTPLFPALDVLADSSLLLPVPAVLSWLSRPGCPVQALLSPSLVFVVKFWPCCRICPVPAILSQVPCPDLSCPDYPVSAVILLLLPCPGCPRLPLHGCLECCMLTIKFLPVS